MLAIDRKLRQDVPFDWIKTFFPAGRVFGWVRESLRLQIAVSITYLMMQAVRDYSRSNAHFEPSHPIVLTSPIKDRHSAMNGVSSPRTFMDSVPKKPCRMASNMNAFKVGSISSPFSPTSKQSNPAEDSDEEKQYGDEPKTERKLATEPDFFFSEQLVEARRRTSRPGVRKTNSSKGMASVRDRMKAFQDNSASTTTTIPSSPCKSKAPRHHSFENKVAVIKEDTVSSPAPNSPEPKAVVQFESSPSVKDRLKAFQIAASSPTSTPSTSQQKTASHLFPTRKSSNRSDESTSRTSSFTLKGEKLSTPLVNGTDDESEIKLEDLQRNNLEAEDDDAFERSFCRVGRISGHHLRENLGGSNSRNMEEEEEEEDLLQTIDEAGQNLEHSDDTSNSTDSTYDERAHEAYSMENEEKTECPNKKTVAEEDPLLTTSYQAQQRESLRRYGRPQVRRTKSTEGQVLFADRLKAFQKK